jgi:hypothetical protein
MSTIEVNAGGGLSVEAELVDDLSVVPLGVEVDFHPGILPAMKRIVLETALRHWQRQVGSVVRGAKPANLEWLPGWTLQAFQKGTVVRMRIAYREGDSGSGRVLQPDREGTQG